GRLADFADARECCNSIFCPGMIRAPNALRRRSAPVDSRNSKAASLLAPPLSASATSNSQLRSRVRPLNVAVLLVVRAAEPRSQYRQSRAGFRRRSRTDSGLEPSEAAPERATAIPTTATGLPL